jgi:hypothetical protein
VQTSDGSSPLFGFVPQRLLDVAIVAFSLARCMGGISLRAFFAGASSLRLTVLPGCVALVWVLSSLDSGHGTGLLLHASMQTRRLHLSPASSLPEVTFDPGWRAVSSVVLVTFPFASSVS